jgi:glycosyltransferase involved in cell wall biosynthesis
MKKILHLITSLQGGGTENFLSQILIHSPAGYDHQVLYLKKDGVIGDRLRQHNIPVKPVESLFTLYRTLRNETPALLHTCLYSAHLVGRLLGYASGVPAVITSQRSIDIWQKPWQTLLDRWTLPFSDAVIVNSHAAAQVIGKRRGSRVRPEIIEIPNSVDFDRFKPTDRTAARRRYHLPEDAVVGGTLMRLHREKGSDFIPDFARRLLSDIPYLHLVIGGVGPLESTLKKALNGTAYETRVHFTGWVDNTVEFLSACDFFWSLSREESFPQTLVEASALGLPWIAPDTGGVAELLFKGSVGQIYPRLDIPAAVHGTKELLEDLPERVQKARQSRELLQAHYSLPKMIRDVYAIFDRY